MKKEGVFISFNLLECMILRFALCFFMVSCIACNPGEKQLVFNIIEKDGINRELEYIELNFSLKDLPSFQGDISLREIQSGRVVEGQVMDSVFRNEELWIRAIFPVTLEANQSKSFQVLSEQGVKALDTLIVRGEGTERTIENNHYVADLTSGKGNEENGIGSGQLSGLRLKKFNNVLLERSHISMHWAPSFQRKGMPYKTIAHLKTPDTVQISKGPYLFKIYRSGTVPEFPEIFVRSCYWFYAGLPYFTFFSEMVVQDSIKLNLLRNDEMTMDSLFTHLIYPTSSGPMDIPLYQEETFEKLNRDPIPDDVSWLGFYNQDYAYGFSSLRLTYSNVNLSGEPSPTYQPYTKISKSVGNGRYWNRVLIKDSVFSLPPGSRYSEKNAYLIFSSVEKRSEVIGNWKNKIEHPLVVERVNH